MNLYEHIESFKRRESNDWASKEFREIEEARYVVDEILTDVDACFLQNGNVAQAAANAYQICDDMYCMAAAYLYDLLIADELAGCSGEIDEMSIPGMYDLLELHIDSTDYDLGWLCEVVAHEMHETMQALWELMVASKLGLL